MWWRPGDSIDRQNQVTDYLVALKFGWNKNFDVEKSCTMEKSYCLHTLENDKCTGLCLRNITSFKIKKQEVNIEFTDMWKEGIYYCASCLQNP